MYGACKSMHSQISQVLCKLHKWLGIDVMCTCKSGARINYTHTFLVDAKDCFTHDFGHHGHVASSKGGILSKGCLTPDWKFLVLVSLCTLVKHCCHNLSPQPQSLEPIVIGRMMPIKWVMYKEIAKHYNRGFDMIMGRNQEFEESECIKNTLVMDPRSNIPRGQIGRSNAQCPVITRNIHSGSSFFRHDVVGKAHVMEWRRKGRVKDIKFHAMGWE
ncbi:hypothetical protein DL93DRAFT_2161492 [Clavulina sp. PMI_390]|nr:hypothetical protein DL93DRAFT_2161492 [Clavulina sp. PMI_390]